MPPAAIPTRDAFDAFRSTLDHRGVRAALVYLLGLTDYRFIGIWRFEHGKANAVVHYDRENPEVLEAQEVDDSATYCCYVRDSRGVFKTADALLDPRTAGHPAREAVPSYCGVPVFTSAGELLATLCHYDVVPRDPEQIDIELMVQVTSALAYGGHVPAYRGAGSSR